jgi:hypothetical protein
MAQNPAEPPPLEQRSEIGPQTGAPERSGPLAIARHVKDDGRALLLYTCAEREPT